MLKKAMVFTLAASMLVGTPLTASAAGIRGVYSISDGTGTVKGDPNDSGTGTVTNTNTETGSSVLQNYDAKIIGIVLDKEHVNAVKGEQESLKATIILDGMDDEAARAGIQKQLASKIRWEVSNVDGSKDTNPAATVSIQSSASDRSVVYLNPKKGTKDCKETIRVTAKIDRAYYWVEKRDASGNVVRDEAGKPVLEMKDTGIDGEPYTASATVSVKEYSKEIKLIGMPETAYTKHTVNMMDYLVRTPETANDEITWISTNTKAATVTATGLVTFKKVGQSGEIIAVTETGKTANWTFGKVDAGLPASKVVITDEDAVSTDENPDRVFLGKKVAVDLQEQNPWTRNVDVIMYAKVKAAVLDENGKPKMQGKKVKTVTKEFRDGEHYDGVNADGTEVVKDIEVKVTDVITWGSNKKDIVAVDQTTGDSAAELETQKSIGKAMITAKASGGKSDKLTVTVKATLSSLEIAEDTPSLLYSGQSWQMEYTRDPVQSKDAVVWEIEKVGNKKNPNATINNKGVLTIKPKLDLLTDDYGDQVAVVVRSKKKYTPNGYNEVDEKGYISAKVYITLAQSNIEGIAVSDDDGVFAFVQADYKANGKFNKILKNKSVTKEIAAEKSKTYTVRTIVEKVVDEKPVISDIYSADYTDTLSWKTSNAKIAEVMANPNGTVTVKAKAKGTATITVSGIRENKAISTTFKVSVKQPAKTVTLNKSLVVLNQKDKKGVPQKQTVSFKATLGPKGVDGKKNPITWTVTPSGDNVASIKNGKLTLTAPEVGDEFVVTASVASGASATATVKVVNKTADVAIAKTDVLDDGQPQLFTETVKNKLTSNVKYITIGEESFKMYPFVKIDNVWQKAGSPNCEDVTYTVDKKGIVTIDSDGTVTPVKNGTVKITAKTPLGKKKTLKVVVSLPTAE